MIFHIFDTFCDLCTLPNFLQETGQNRGIMCANCTNLRDLENR